MTDDTVHPLHERVRDNAAQNRFELDAFGATAIADYRLHGDRMEITHTLVRPELRGKGVAGELIEGALLEARRRGLKVVPTCAYVDAYLRRHPEFADLRG